MITRFRVEATHSDKEKLMEQLQDAVCEIMKMSSNVTTAEESEPHGEWECTDDVISRVNGGYRGRMVFIFHDTSEVG